MSSTQKRAPDEEKEAPGVSMEFCPPPTGGHLRSALVLVPIILWTLLGATFIALLALIARSWTRRRLQSMVRIWGRVPLAVAGVRVELHGQEHLEAQGPKLFLFNHVSTLDLLLLGAHAPPSPCVACKREFRRIPGIG